MKISKKELAYNSIFLVVFVVLTLLILPMVTKRPAYPDGLMVLLISIVVGGVVGFVGGRRS